MWWSVDISTHWLYASSQVRLDPALFLSTLTDVAALTDLSGTVRTGLADQGPGPLGPPFLGGAPLPLLRCVADFNPAIESILLSD